MESRLAAWAISRVGLLKDAVVAVGGFVYLLGYLVWSYYAWRYDIGPVPALQGQYFVAGIAVCIVFGAAGCLAYLIIRAADVSWPRYLDSRTPAVRRLLFGLAIAILLLAVVVVLVAVNARFVATMIAVTLLPFVLSALRATSHLSRKLIRVALIGYIGSMTMFAVLQLIEQWYPLWPQELGGGKPRFAYVTIYKSAVGNGGLAYLVSDQRRDSDVVQTRPLFVLVRTNDYLIVSPDPPNRRFHGENARTEIPTKAIAGIVWIQDR